ncbi:MAG: DinB family protein [Thermoactinomyces sp.]
MANLETFLHSWLRHRLVLVDLVDAFPEDQLDFKPYDQAMPVKELVMHIIFSANLFVETVKSGELVRPDESSKPQVNSMADLRRLVREWTEKTKATIAGLSQEALARKVDVSKILGTSLTGEVILNLMRDHEIHHKGQLYVYARLAGMKEVPSFVKKDL